MLSKARTITGIVAAAAGLVAIASPAFASDVDHNSTYNGINVGNGNNVQVPVGICGNNVAVLGAVVPVLSPQSVDNCSTAVINQHHKKPPHGCECTTTEQPTSSEKPTETETSTESETSTETESPTGSHHPTGSHRPTSPGGPGEQLPSAPQPTPITGHHAVTG